MEVEEYFRGLEAEIDRVYQIAGEARAKGLDPASEVEALPAGDVAARVEGRVGPPGIAEKIRAVGRDNITQIVDSILDGEFGLTVEERITQAVRTALDILTEGVVAASMDGISETRVRENPDGSRYLSIYFAGPIRSAGGTGQGMAVLISDYIRKRMGLSQYRPTKDEVERYVEEIKIYNDRVTRLQYLPSEDDVRRIVEKTPVCIDGEPTEKREVAIHRDLPNVETNRIRGGMCLVVAEGMAQKSAKLARKAQKLDLDWEWLSELGGAGSHPDDEDAEAGVKAAKFMDEVVGGRPIFAAPSAKGALRLRYGKSRANGIAGKSIHPATMVLTGGFIATGTQVKVEKPGKGCIITECDEIEGPIVKLDDGSVVRVESAEQARDIKPRVSEILFLGDILVSYGDFLQTNTNLLPAGYCEEWWMIDARDAGVVFDGVPSPGEAVELSMEHDIPLHPRYTYRFRDLGKSGLKDIVAWILAGRVDGNLVLSAANTKCKRLLEVLGVPHRVSGDDVVVAEHAPLLASFGIKTSGGLDGRKITAALQESRDDEDGLSIVRKSSLVRLMDKTGTYIGCRMGRPEKAKERRMRPAVHSLFPIGQAGGRERSINKAVSQNTVSIDLAKFKCTACGSEGASHVCGECGAEARLVKSCPVCKINSDDEKCPKCGGRMQFYRQTDVDISKLWSKAVEKVGRSADVKGVLGMISAYKIPEPLEKGLLRALNNLYVFKDGTIRFDATDAPLTHFKPNEVGVGIEELKKLGYLTDYLGEPLADQEQVIELKVQDVVIPLEGAKYLLKTAKFVDQLLERFYGLPAYYNAERIEDLLGHAIVGLAPHTSAAISGRIMGFTRARVCFAHPFWHAAKRRNCLAPATEVLVLNSSTPKFVSLECLFEGAEDGRVVDDFGTVEKKIRGVSTLALNPKTSRFEGKRIESVIKTPAPEHLIEVRTKSGRTFTASPEHRLMINLEGSILFKKTVELGAGDNLMVPERMELPESDIPQIDLLKEFSAFDGLKTVVMVRGVREFTADLVSRLGGLKTAGERLGVNKKTFSNYVYRDSIPLPVLENLLEFCGMSLDDVPKCRLGVKRDRTEIKRTINVDDKFMRLIGYYLAEGYSRMIEGGCYQVSFACPEGEMADDISNCVRRVFGLTPHRSKQIVVASNRLAYHFLRDVLEIGCGARDKRIPPQLISLPKPKVREMLRAYFAGDGSVERGRLHVTCSSVNKGLLRDVGLLLTRFGIFYRLKSERKTAGGLAKEFYIKKGRLPEFELHYISIRSNYARIFHDEVGFSLKRKQRTLASALPKERKSRVVKSCNLVLDPVKEIRPVKSKHDFLYDIRVEGYHNFLMDDLVVSGNCDGDEDSFMLLLEVLLNFSRRYLPEKRGGQMDAPLVVTTLLNPTEIDDEAHKIEAVTEYGREFYDNTLLEVNPSQAGVPTVASTIADRPYSEIKFTHSTGDVTGPVTQSEYVKLETMVEKVEAQLAVAEKIRAIDERDVAELVINSHFLRDTYGNLRAFSRQRFRCVKCNENYRRVPLAGKCTKCGGRILLTVTEGNIRKYLGASKDIAGKYGLSDYLKSRLNLLEQNITSLFTNDLDKQVSLADYM